MGSVVGVTLVVLVGMMVMLLQESSGIGQIYCFNSNECPKIQTIPYDILPVVVTKRKPKAGGFLETIKSVIHGSDFQIQNESGRENRSVVVVKPRERVRIRGLELIYYGYLPSDRTVLSFIGGLLICAIFGFNLC